ncbi:MAG: flagellar biosynthesis protein FlhB [Gammaproteobacteria bacterium]|nr:flagellar biosynthesis protein FlhB [Gammaproteobacteria bacterium]MDP2140852.1 flagellar biosynthesis protein FlhB [Gammaproteobacteria bacterium]MDP2349405.1 flagellar biosynthesis protein FlhB [Gammaproteobacteria bacterium]
MAEDKDSSAEKSQEPTQKRREDARGEGNIARSRELNTMAILLGGAAAIIAFGGIIVEALRGIMRYNFVLDRTLLFDTSAMLRQLDDSVFAGFISLLPVFAVLLLLAFLAPIALGGWNFSVKAIMPKASRMNPLKGLARMFGAKALVELAKAIAKVVFVAALSMLVLYINTDNLLGMQHEPTLAAMAHALNVLAWSVLWISCAMIFITLIDIPIQIFDHTQKLRMTMQQVKDEMKDTDGRPEVKQRIRQLQYQMAQNRMMSDVQEADVIITNPEHYAVALRYDQSREAAPVMLAKGADLVAQKIREIAQEHRIPIVSSPALARAIYFNTKIGEEIPGGLYVAVAQVLAYLHQLKLYARGRAKKPVLTANPDIPEELQHD